MRVYFDLPNFRSYVKSASNENFKTCNNMLKEHGDIFLAFDKDSLKKEGKQVLQAITQWTTQMNSGVKNNTIVWDKSIGKRPLSDSFYDEIEAEDYHALFFLTDDNASTLSNHGCLLIAEEKKEIPAIMSLFVENVATKEFNARKMTDWQLIETHASPCTDIIIVDPFVFSQPEVTHDDNVYSIIRKLCKHAVGKAPNIVLIYNFGKASTTFKTVIDKTKQITKEETNEESNVTLVDISKAEHDRYIITNYKRFKSGDSFTYFDGSKNATKGRDFTIVSHYDRDNLENNMDILADLQVLIDQKKGAAIPGVHGDMVSYLLNF